MPVCSSCQAKRQFTVLSFTRILAAFPTLNRSDVESLRHITVPTMGGIAMRFFLLADARKFAKFAESSWGEALEQQTPVGVTAVHEYALLCAAGDTDARDRLLRETEVLRECTSTHLLEGGGDRGLTRKTD